VLGEKPVPVPLFRHKSHTCHFSDTNPTQNETGLNMEFWSERLVTNCMSHGMARRWRLDRRQ